MAHQLLQNLKNETEPQRTEQRKGRENQNELERRLLATVRWTVATAVALPQQSESIVINRRLTEVSMKIEASLSLLKKKLTMYLEN